PLRKSLSWLPDLLADQRRQSVHAGAKSSRYIVFEARIPLNRRVRDGKSNLGNRGRGDCVDEIELYRGFFALTARRWVALAFCLVSLTPSSLLGQPLSGPAKIEHGLKVVRPGGVTASRLNLRDALVALNISSVSVALIDRGTLAWRHAWGHASTC